MQLYKLAFKLNMFRVASVIIAYFYIE